MGNGLADRVNARAQVAQRNGGEVAANPEKTLRAEIERMSDQFAMAMPQGFEAKQLIRDAHTLIRQTPDLALCVPQTVLGGLMTFAQLGLRPGVMGQGWLIPFKNWKQGNRLEAQIVIGYQGYVELVHRSGAVQGIVGRAVHANDEFRVQFGLREDLVHNPAPLGQTRGDVVAYYAILRLKDADPLFWVMSREEAIEWRDYHAMGTRKFKGEPVRDADGNAQGAGPWFDMTGPAGGTGFDQMAIKTCFLRAKRWAPKSTDRLLTVATEVDGAVRMGFGNPKDLDEMLDAKHPEPEERPDVIDAEAEEATLPTSGDPMADRQAAATGRPVGEQPAPQEREQVTVTRQADDDVPPPPDPAAPAAPGGDGPAADGQGRALAAIMRQGLSRTPEQAERRTILSALVGREVKSQKDLTFGEASGAIDKLNAWQKGGDLGARLTAILGSATVPAGEAPAAAAEEAIPDPDTDAAAWHADRHPRRLEGGRIDRVPFLATCEWCDAETDDDEQMTPGMDD